MLKGITIEYYFIGKKLVLLILSLSLLTAIGSVSADVSDGVKKGDWIEYKVTYTGTPPEGHEVKWARMEVSGVQGAAISLIMTTAARTEHRTTKS